eukprot:3390263-Alexandrium_andersonii.AAC.1
MSTARDAVSPLRRRDGRPARAQRGLAGARDRPRGAGHARQRAVRRAGHRRADCLGELRDVSLA